MSDFAAHLLSAWSRSGRGRAVLAAWALAAAGLTITSSLARRRARAEAKAAAAAAAADGTLARADGGDSAVVPARGAPKPASATRVIVRTLVPAWRSAPVAHAASLALAIGLRRWAATRMSVEIGALGGLLATREWDALFAREISFAIWALPTAALAAATQYATARLALALRAALEREWRAAVASGALGRIAARAGADGGASGAGGTSGSTVALVGATAAVASPPLALAPADVAVVVSAESDALCAELASLCAGIAKPTIEAAMLIGTLGRLMGARQLAAALGFYAVAGGWVRSIGPAFSALRERQAAAAAALAARHARVQADAEAVHALRAHATEARALGGAWARAARAASALDAQQLLAGTVETYTLRYVGILAAFTAMTPAVYPGVAAAAGATAAGAAAAGATEYFLASLHLLVDLGLCMRDLAGAHRVARTVDGLAARVSRLLDAARDAERAASASEEVVGLGDGGGGGRRLLVEREALELERVTILPPAPAGARPLVRELSVRLAPGESLLVRGPNGAGKTALLRVISGWWTAADGEVRVPAAAVLAYLPQRPLVMPEHSIREALLYPREPAEGGAGAHGSRAQPTDGELTHALREVGLEGLLAAVGARAPRASSVGALDVGDACRGLSGGEQQRLAAARALLARPTLLLLDEPAAATSADFEGWLYAELARRGIGFVTVSHSPAAARWHSRVLELGGADGGWRLVPGGEAQ
ncbi:hypothetical protein KFE25_011421 [Diacronema lutheri]|uniref:ABC transporter domain-containing protein n=1 Tax=Diacronema lutheri TaxID=2081491 RepID=A0A8J5X4E2_DIALT|nr:hypothetical protein KFE25_011421 [Diacronema lutheri]